MMTSHVSRRGFLTGATLVALAGALPYNMPSAAAVPQDQLEAELAALDKPIYLLETFVPDTFGTDPGSSLSISAEHGKVGQHSLRWDYRSRASLRVQTPVGYKDRTGGSVDYFAVWVYNEDPIDDHLRFQFGRGADVDAWFDFHLDFTGWRTVWVRYGKDTEGTPQIDMDRITVVAPSSAGTVWIDQLITSVPLRPDRPTPDFQVPTLAPDLKQDNNFHWMGLLAFWGQREDPGFDTSGVTSAEIEDAQTIHDRLLDRQRADQPFDGAALSALEELFASYGIPQLADPDASGDDLRPAAPGSFINDRQTEIIPGKYRSSVEEFADACKLRPLWEECGLPAAQTWDSAHRAGDDAAAARAGQLVLRLMAHMHDQGWATGSGLGTIHHIGYTWRSWVRSLLMLEPLLRERDLWDQVATTLEWFAGSGRLLNDFTDNLDHSGMADVLNTLLEGLLTTCFAPDAWEDRVGRLRAFHSWIDHAYSYSPGISGGFKPDGSLYHHVGPYSLYARDALSGSTPVIVDCVGTAFALGPAGQQVLKQALRYQVLIANTLDYPLSQCGRQQTGTWDIRSLVDPHALTGGTPLDGGVGYDEEQAAMFRRLLPRDEPSEWQLEADQEFARAGIAEAPAPNGYWAMPYGATGLRRQDEWQVTIRSHNRYIWTTEIYNKNNIYGRYQTYGQVTVLADTDADAWATVEENGIVQPGYDWNLIPGATTKTLPFDQLAVPLSGKIESLPLTESRFGGSGVMGEHATVFGMELREHPSFDPSHTARISALMVGDRVIALGSGVRNDDSSNPTRTTLFQVCPEVMPTPQKVTSGQDWVTDPTGNGYVVFGGPEITHRTASQTTPDQSGTKEATRVVALGYLDHGTAPRDAGYAYTMLVQGGAQRTGDLAEQMRGEDAPVQVHQRDRVAHVVTDVASQVTAHVVFEPDAELVEESVVRSASRQVMVLSRPDGDARATAFSLTDPDLHLYRGRDEEQYAPDGTYVGDESPYTRPWRYNESLQTETTVVLQGRWRVSHPRDVRRVGLRLRNLPSGDTAATVPTQHGMSVEFSLIQTANPPGNDK